MYKDTKEAQGEIDPTRGEKEREREKIDKERERKDRRERDIYTHTESEINRAGQCVRGSNVSERRAKRKVARAS